MAGPVAHPAAIGPEPDIAGMSVQIDGLSSVLQFVYRLPQLAASNAGSMLSK